MVEVNLVSVIFFSSFCFSIKIALYSFSCFCFDLLIAIGFPQSWVVQQINDWQKDAVDDVVSYQLDVQQKNIVHFFAI